MNNKFFLWIVLILLLGATILLLVPKKNLEENRNYCTLDSRNAELCTEIYQPVCGYVQVECITTPCDPVPETFSNSCFACMNERTQYYVDGECS